MRLMQILVALVMVLGGWSAYGEVVAYEYYFGCLTPHQTKPFKIKVPVLPANLGDEENANVSIVGQLHVEGKETCYGYEGEPITFRNRKEMISYVRENYCTHSNWPVGEVFFTHNELKHKISLGVGRIDSKVINYFDITFDYLYKIIRDNGEWDGEGGGSTVRCELPSNKN